MSLSESEANGTVSIQVKGRSVGGHQMYSGGSGVRVRFGRFNSWYRDVDHTSSSFHRESKSAKFSVVFNVTQLLTARV